MIDLSKYFEVNYENTFPKGPVIVAGYAPITG
jgi:hypothetical protein